MIYSEKDNWNTRCLAEVQYPRVDYSYHIRKRYSRYSVFPRPDLYVHQKVYLYLLKWIFGTRSYQIDGEDFQDTTAYFQEI